MAIYHCSIKIIGRSAGRSAVACAAYRAGDKLVDQETGIVSDYTRKGGVAFSEINLCKNAPEEYADRETLWNSVERIENKSNSQLAREIEVALPAEMTRDEQIECVRQYVTDSFVSQGMIADWSLHDKGDGNPHAHIMLTTRPIKDNGEWGIKESKVYKLDQNGERIPVIDPETGEQKIGARGRKIWQRELTEKTGWSRPEMAEIWREKWADSCNRYLDIDDQIDHRSYARQGLDIEPTVHEGVAARQMEARGEISDLCQTNREIMERRSLLVEVKEKITEITVEIKELIKQKIEAIETGLERIGDLFGRFGGEIERYRGPAFESAGSGITGETAEWPDLEDNEREREPKIWSVRREADDIYTEEPERGYGEPDQGTGIADIGIFLRDLEIEEGIAEEKREDSESRAEAAGIEREARDIERERLESGSSIDYGIDR